MSPRLALQRCLPYPVTMTWLGSETSSEVAPCPSRHNARVGRTTSDRVRRIITIGPSIPPCLEAVHNCARSRCATFPPVPAHTALFVSTLHHQTTHTNSAHFQSCLSGSLGLAKLGHVVSNLFDLFVCGCSCSSTNFFIVHN